MPITRGTISYYLLVDWNGDGEFLHEDSDISEYIVLGTLRASRGRNYPNRIRGAAVAGRLTCTLTNPDDLLDPSNVGSRLAVLNRSGRAVRLQRQLGPATAETIWQGRLQTMRRVGTEFMRLTAMGNLITLNTATVSIPQQTNISTADAATMLIPEADRGTIEGNRTMARWYVHEQNPLQALKEIEETENGELYETAQGLIGMRASNYRTTGLRLGPLVRFSDEPSFQAIPWVQDGHVPDVDDANLANRIEVPVRNFTTLPEQVLWTTVAGQLPVPAAATTTIRILYPLLGDTDSHRGVSSWVTPVAGTDYTAHAGLTVSGVANGDEYRLSLTNATTSTILLTDVGTKGEPGFIPAMQVRGRPIEEGEPIPIEVSDPSSVMLYRAHDFTSPSQWISNVADAVSYGSLVLSALSEPRESLRLTYFGDDSTINMDLSDRVRVTKNGFSTDYFVEAITHSLLPGATHLVALQLSEADQVVVDNVVHLDVGPAIGIGVWA